MDKKIEKELKRLDNRCNTLKENDKILRDNYEVLKESVRNDMRTKFESSRILSNNINKCEKIIDNTRSMTIIILVVLILFIIFSTIITSSMNKRITELESKVYETQIDTKETSLGE